MKKIYHLLSLLILASVLAACISRTPTVEMDIALTQAAATIYAQGTLDAGSTAVAQVTGIAGTARSVAVSTLFPTQSTATITATSTLFVVPPLTSTPTSPSPIIFTLTPTFTAIAPTLTPQPAAPVPPPCIKATFVQDVSIPDGTVMAPGTRFVKTWRVRNDGSCTWDTNYQLVFSSGVLMSANTSVRFPKVTPPGDKVDLSVEMQAPNAANVYKSDWLMRSSSGQTFGVGSNGMQVLFVRINVTPTVAPNPAYNLDFAANYCNAQWRTGSGIIECKNPSSDSRGSVILTVTPNMEDRVEDEPALWVRPNQASSGFISGQYPTYKVQQNDHFISKISCVKNYAKCDVLFQLDAVLANGTTYNLGKWREKNEGKSYTVDVDLKSLVGQNVQFILQMINKGDVSQAQGYWFLPSIRKVTTPPPTSTPPPPPPTSTPPGFPTLPPIATIPPFPTIRLPTLPKP
jgi:hypothetical protein